MLGVDSEYFFVDETGLAVPAKDVIATHPDKKEVFKPIFSDIEPDGYWSSEIRLNDATITEDGLAMEIPVTPSPDPDVILNRLSLGLKEAWNLAESQGLLLSAAPLVYLNPKDLEDHPELRVLGCAPDMCLYNQDFGVPPQNPIETHWRTSGFHVHFSIPNHKDMMVVDSLVRMCDCTIGLADVLFENSELGKQRREMYGSAGKFRIQKWGIEYRTPSGAVSSNKNYTETILRLAKALHTVIEEDLFEGYDMAAELGFSKVIAAINNVDMAAAKSLYQQSLEFLNMFDLTTKELYLPLEERKPAYIMEDWK